MKKLLTIIGSMKTMAALMLFFAVASGVATFIENDFGAETAKAVVYNALWFEVLLAVLALNLILNIITFGMFQRKKALVFLFHFSFLLILVGAAVTRYAGYEGVMHIREGETENRMTSSESYLSLLFKEGEAFSRYEMPLLLSKLSDNRFEKTISVDGTPVTFKLLEYLPNASYELVEASDGTPVVEMMVSHGERGEQLQLRQGEFFIGDDVVIDFASGQKFEKPVISLSVREGELHMKHPMPLQYMKMDDQSKGVLFPSEGELLPTRTLFTVSHTNFVMRKFMPSAKEELVSTPASSQSALRLELSSGDERAQTVVMGSAGVIGENSEVRLGGMEVKVRYGAEIIELPFALKLVDFQLERYPGSMSPMSYASEVVMIDREQNIEMPFRIYMNHILDHRGYRFFQSSYDEDEQGTVLSVNHDPGTLITYVGYLLLGIGMFGALFLRNGRFAKLSKIAREASQQKAAGAVAAALLAMGAYAPLQAQEQTPEVQTVQAYDRAHANALGELVVQDTNGRMKPLDTLATQIVAKINRSSTILGLNANQVILGMLTRPEAWQEIEMIHLGHKELNALIGVDADAKKAAFSSFFEVPEEVTGYKLSDAVEVAMRKAPGKRSKYEKALLKLDERVNVAYMVFNGSMLQFWPKPLDAGNKWSGTVEALQTFDSTEGLIVRELALNYFTAIDKALPSGDWSEADAALAKIKAHQKLRGAAVYPDEMKLKMEIWYNHANIFERLWPFYFLLGFLLLILSFVKILRPSFRLGIFTKTTLGLLIVFFVLHTIGLGMRWYISGHAPWSDGYESMIYIAWATVLAGFIFSKNSPITMAATSILTGLILFVAHLNWMDPQVTNLAPVLQSYWLSIHVSMITASYGFLGLGALLGFITLLLFILRNEKNAKHIGLSIKELNAINEMSLLIGLVLLTVGNFLGGVWANESWGRYWGWDPKETWALVTILLYSVVVHLRFIKALYSPFVYSAVSLLAFTSVLMTYFGVNYYLAGLHSYAKGDPVPVPDFVPVTYTIIFIIIALAYRKRNLAV